MIEQRQNSTALSEEQAQIFLQATGVARPPSPPETTLEEDENNPDLAISNENPCEKSEALCEFMTNAKNKAIKTIQGIYSQEVRGLRYTPEEIALLQSNVELYGYNTLADYVRYVTLNVVMHPVVLKPESKKEVE